MYCSDVYVGVPMHCSRCGTRRDALNEFGLCQLSSLGTAVFHTWVPNEPASQPSQQVVEQRKAILPEDSAARKELPIYSGVIRYFPRALAYLAKISKFGADKHCGGELRWDRSKSTDHLDCVARHLEDAGTQDANGIRHSGYLLWRAAANLEEELEAAGWPESEDK